MRNVALPLASMLTEGTLRNTSSAVPPRAVMSLSTLNTRRSIFICTVLFSAVTTASLSCLLSNSSCKLPRSCSILSFVISMTLCKGLKPKKVIFNRNFPNGNCSNEKSPLPCVNAPLITESLRMAYKTTEAYSIDSLVFESCTLPNTRPIEGILKPDGIAPFVGFCACAKKNVLIEMNTKSIYFFILKFY